MFLEMTLENLSEPHLWGCLPFSKGYILGPYLYEQIVKFLAMFVGQGRETDTAGIHINLGPLETLVYVF
jgi:hypothetical protein